MGTCYLTFDFDCEDVINDLIGSSITYRVAVGKNKGKKVYTLQTVPAQLEDIAENKALAKESGFSLHAGVSAKSYQKDKIERLCRYITRPAVSLKRVFNIDITLCQHCQGTVRIIACIKDESVIDKILSHINKKPENQATVFSTLTIRGPPDLRFTDNSE